MVRVYLNGRAMHVPSKVEGHYAVRGWLGIQRGWHVCRETEPETFLVFAKGHEFKDGESYITENGSALFQELPNDP